LIYLFQEREYFLNRY